jgi:hypothetical protein
LVLANLPQHSAKEAQNIYFVSCCNRANALQISDPIVDDLLKLERGICTYDCFLKSDVIVISPVVCLLCDNARASELQGSTATRLCRMCTVSYFNVISYK